jgi:hypothetical protein
MLQVSRSSVARVGLQMAVRSHTPLNGQRFALAQPILLIKDLTPFPLLRQHLNPNLEL